jgi:asparagine synthase (glutamine-hydrolysing)
MCGLAGYLGSGKNQDQGIAILERMTDQLIHRGPDGHGAWLDGALGVGLAHRRLSIVDLSELGHQPMCSHSGRYVVAYNGEIYNFRELRSQLKKLGYKFHGHSDTELLLAVIDRWGVEKALESFVGMFAFSLWDRNERTLTLVRDRMGEKPLYYGWQGDSFLFGSELKALRKHPSWKGGVNRDALAQFLRYNYIPGSLSIHPGIKKLSPGHLVQVRYVEGKWETGKQQLWWSLDDVVKNKASKPFSGTDKEAIDELERLLHQSVDGQKIADVPIGAFLSGGIDSSVVVSVMQALSNKPVRTFTIGYAEPSYDESTHAKMVAKHLGTEHEDWIVTASDAMAIIPDLPQLYDEPFADASQIPTALVAKLARRHVTVALSGDGADELFGGYNRHTWAPAIRQRIGRFPKPLRAFVAHCFSSISPNNWDRVFTGMRHFFSEKYQVRNPGEKIHKLADLLNFKDKRDLYARLVRAWRDPVPVIGGSSQDTIVDHNALWTEKGSFAEQMMCLDAATYLPDDILVKVDRAAMSTSLETRVPFLDHRIVEFSASLPLGMKIRNGQGKWIVRGLLDRYVPRELIERPKSGFGVPIHDWLRGPIRGWAEDLLSEKKLREDGYFDVKSLRAAWNDHLSGKKNMQYCLWSVLMFQAWLVAYK